LGNLGSVGRKAKNLLLFKKLGESGEFGASAVIQKSKRERF
jgi:hypothetical protein